MIKQIATFDLQPLTKGLQIDVQTFFNRFQHDQIKIGFTQRPTHFPALFLMARPLTHKTCRPAKCSRSAAIRWLKRLPPPPAWNCQSPRHLRLRETHPQIHFPNPRRSAHRGQRFVHRLLTGEIGTQCLNKRNERLLVVHTLQQLIKIIRRRHRGTFRFVNGLPGMLLCIDQRVNQSVKTAPASSPASR
ncbi:hypothetical protein V5O39_11860 [Pseudomonas parakoreensis]